MTESASYRSSGSLVFEDGIAVEVFNSPMAQDGRVCRATWDGEVAGLALLYVYAPNNPGTKGGESVRQMTNPATVCFDYAADGRLLGAEVIVELPEVS